jgi:adenylate cyclase
MEGRKPTLRQASFGFLLALALLLVGLLYRLSETAREAVVLSSGPLRDTTAELVGRSVEGYLQAAEASIGRVEIHLLQGRCSLDLPPCAESALLTELVSNPDLVETAFTHAGNRGKDGGVAPENRWQVSLSRRAEGGLVSRVVRFSKGHFRSEIAEWQEGSGFRGRPTRITSGEASDPTLHPTFRTPASLPFRDKIVWSDLSFSELDSQVPEKDQRVVVTVMKAFEDSAALAGVVRMGLLENKVDSLVAPKPGRPERLFIFDGSARLISRLDPQDLLEVQGEDLRIEPRRIPPEIARALGDPLAVPSLGPTKTAFAIEGRRFLASFRRLQHSQEWHLGLVVAEDQLPGIAELRVRQQRLFVTASLVGGAILIGGFFALGLIRTDLTRIVDSTTRMGQFDFAPTRSRVVFRDVEAVMLALERAKTALRALGKYVPVDLVRLLYQSGQEPFPGGVLHDCSLLFTDIEGFTTLSEELSPDELAKRLGAYFEVMAASIQQTEGTIDKFIGDAVMAIWNAPLPVLNHPEKACEAALRSMEATSRLYQSPEWGARPSWVTRFGLHRDEVMLGHFGAPNRLSYTVIGDGVNLASRLEGLNKQYGTAILASQSIRDASCERFAFRLVDRVAVKGKTRGILVYELLGPLPRPREERIFRYEKALEAYWGRDFEGAIRELEGSKDDPPSRVLEARCRLLRAEPPPPDWDGVFVSKSK